ncbi:MAG TPA: DUF748 domain-containing protein [Steroidobacteraceae bacterium]
MTIGIIAAALLAIRAALPYAVREYVNRTLQGFEAYDGSIEDVDLSLLRGAYRIEGIRLVKRGVESETPFFDCEQVDLSIEWPSLLKGSLVSEVVFIHPALNLIQDETKERTQTGREEDWQAKIEELAPFRFNTIRVLDGTVTFRAPGIRTQDALTAEHVDGIVTNLTNVEDANQETFAKFEMHGSVLGTAPARVSGSLDPWAKVPTFDINVEVQQVALPQVNPWLRRFIKADAESGDFEMYVEIAAADGKFKGYAKPILRNVNITSAAEKEENPLRKLWEGIVEFAANIFENKPEDQVAARVPFSGTIEDPDANIWLTIVSVVRNAFVSAFARSLEGSISIRDVKQNLSELSGGNQSEEAGPPARRARSTTKRPEPSAQSPSQKEDAQGRRERAKSGRG